MTRKELDFAVFCIESVAEHLDVSGAIIYEKLKHNTDLLDPFEQKGYQEELARRIDGYESGITEMVDMTDEFL